MVMQDSKPAGRTSSGSRSLLDLGTGRDWSKSGLDLRSHEHSELRATGPQASRGRGGYPSSPSPRARACPAALPWAHGHLRRPHPGRAAEPRCPTTAGRTHPRHSRGPVTPPRQAAQGAAPGPASWQRSLPAQQSPGAQCPPPRFLRGRPWDWSMPNSALQWELQSA